MAEPRKKKRKRKTGRPLEDVPLRKLVQSVKQEIRMSFSAKPDKPKKG